MHDSVERYRKRRDERMGIEPERDAVSEYKIRRQARLEARFDASMKLAYGIAKSLGIDTKGMSPKEVWEAIKKEDPDAHAAAHSGGKKSKRGQEAGRRSGFVDGWRPPKVSGMEEAEVHVVLTKCNKIGGGHYDKAREVANAANKQFLWTFTTHGRDHVQQVIQETNEAAEAIEKLPKKSVFHGAKIDRKLMLVSSWFHDTGMDGADLDWGDDDGFKLRGAHGVCSALHILEHSKEIEKMGVNPSQVAYIALAHTKSKSGIDDLSEPLYMQKGLDTLQSAVDGYNARREKDGKPKITFDAKSVFGGKPSEKNIGHMAAQIAAIRLGDANREANIPLQSQSGGEYKVDKMPKPDECVNMNAEIDTADISITDDEGRHVLSDDDPKMSQVSGRRISKGVVLGERNMAKIDVGVEDDELQEVVTLHNGNDVPYCTAEAILERCGELNTINGVPRTVKIKMTGVKNIESLNENAIRAYDNMVTTILTKAKKRPHIKTGQEETYYTYGGISDVILEFGDGPVSLMGKSQMENVDRNMNRKPT